MKNILFFFVLLVTTLSVNAQEINQKDSNGERHGVWKKLFENGRIRYQGTFNHGKETGTFKFYNMLSSEFPIITKEFNDVDNKATAVFYNEKGALESEGVMQGKTRLGKWVYYHRDGKTIMQEENYVDGKLNGEYKTFFANGKPTLITNYKNDELDGNYKRFAIGGHLYQELFYTHGKLNGEATYYDRLTGKIQKKGAFKDDTRVGMWSFNIDGEMVDVKEGMHRKRRSKK